MPRSRLLIFGALCLFAGAQANGVTVNFSLTNPTTGPFPADAFTSPNASQKTGLNVNLPVPNCSAQPSECRVVAALNQLDGFALQPRVAISFSAAVDPTTLRDAIFFVWLNNLTSDEKGLGTNGQLTQINQVVYDPITNTAYAQPNDFFDQHRRYALIVTDALLDTAGHPVSPDPQFTACIQSPSNAYCSLLSQTVNNLSTAALPGKIVAASVFTTLSATAWLEHARDLLPQVPVAYQPLGTPVKAASIVSVNLRAQTGTNPPSFQTLSLPTPAGTLDGVDRISFGTYQSPSFLNTQQYIPAAPTGAPPALPSARNTIQVHAYVPSSAMPAAGYPVIIYGHGFGLNSLYTATLVASTFAKAGFATVAINAVGHGNGPQSVAQIVTTGGATIDFPGFGRGVDLNGDGQIEDHEGCFLSWPNPFGDGDCMRQTAVDLMQLVSLVGSSVSFEASSGLKFDPGKIYYVGGSLGSMYGTMLEAIDPRVPAAAMSVGGGLLWDIPRWSPSYRSFAQMIVGGRSPSLLNAGSDYNENYVLRNQPPDVNTVAGAIDIQNMFGELNWLGTSGDALSYAPHLSRTTLPGVRSKPVLFSYDVGDQSLPNPQESALIRAAGKFSTSTLFRSDLAGPVEELVCCVMPADSHGFLSNNSNPAALMVARAAQQEFAGFLASNGTTIPDPNAILRQMLPFSTSAVLFDTPGRDLETLNLGTLGISIQENLKLDDTPTIAAVTAATGIANSVQPSIQAGCWVAIYGSNLATGTAEWSMLIDSSGKLPTSVGGVSATIAGKPAYINYVSPGQINLIAPHIPPGDVPVVVTTNGHRTEPVKVHAGAAAPAFFQWGATQYALATRYPDYARVANPSLGGGFVAAKPGDILTLWGTGFGPTDPAQDPSVLTIGTHNVSLKLTVTVGGTPARIVGAALSPGLAGVYQIAIQLPASLPSGDLVVKAAVAGFHTPDNVHLFIN